jgi:hypothetical protein
MALGWSGGPRAGGGRRCINSAERENKKGMQKKFKRDMEGEEKGKRLRPVSHPRPCR